MRYSVILLSIASVFNLGLVILKILINSWDTLNWMNLGLGILCLFSLIFVLFLMRIKVLKW